MGWKVKKKGSILGYIRTEIILKITVHHERLVSQDATCTDGFGIIFIAFCLLVCTGKHFMVHYPYYLINIIQQGRIYEQVHLPKNKYYGIPSNVDWSRISNRENYFQGANHYFLFFVRFVCSFLNRFANIQEVSGSES